MNFHDFPAHNYFFRICPRILLGTRRAPEIIARASYRSLRLPPAHLRPRDAAEGFGRAGIPGLLRKSREKSAENHETLEKY